MKTFSVTPVRYFILLVKIMNVHPMIVPDAVMIVPDAVMIVPDAVMMAVKTFDALS
jgi:hypothetical protein